MAGIVYMDRDKEHVRIGANHLLQRLLVQQTTIFRTTQVDCHFGADLVAKTGSDRVIPAPIVLPEATLLRACIEAPCANLHFPADDESREEADTELPYDIRHIPVVA